MLLQQKGISDKRVLAAMQNVPRHVYMDNAFLEHAYEDKAFPIGSGQTISQPYTVAVQSSLLNIKKGDKVVVIAGANRGAEGSVLQVFPEKKRAIVEGVNIVKKHTKPTNDNPGGINEIAAPIHISNLMLVDPKTGEGTRIGRREENGKMVRYSKKSGEIIK